MRWHGQKTVLPGNVSEASTQRSGCGKSQRRFIALTEKRYKIKHDSAISLKQFYIRNVAELRGKGMPKKRRA